MNERNLTLLTDYYELTMMNGYFTTVAKANLITFFILQRFHRGNGIIVLEYANNKFQEQYGNLLAIKEKKYGYKNIKIFKKMKASKE